MNFHNFSFANQFFTVKCDKDLKQWYFYSQTKISELKLLCLKPKDFHQSFLFKVIILITYEYILSLFAPYSVPLVVFVLEML